MPPAPSPPSADPLVAMADRCVQCGLCLPACPTYRRDGMEPESPRGRIALMRAWALETVEPTPTGDAHLDHCLACRRCEAACPAGVPFAALLVEGRRRQRERRPPGLRQRALEWLAARPTSLARLLGLYRRLHPVLPRGLRPAPRPVGPVAGDPLTTAPPHGGVSGPSSAVAASPLEPSVATPVAHRPDPAPPAAMPPVALFVGCAARAYEPGVRAALAALVTAAGQVLRAPVDQGCCGALHAHAGDTATADALAARTRSAFAGEPIVLTLASGCHGAVADALENGAATDALAWLDARRLPFRASHARVALHLPCTQQHVAGSVAALQRLLAAVPRTDVAVLDAGTGCCGASGTQFLLDPMRAADHRAPLLAQLHAAGVERVLSANLGCRLHLQGGTALPVEHPLEFLARHLDTSPAPAAPLDFAS